MSHETEYQAVERRNPGMTEEQLDYFSEQTNRAVKSALRRYVRGALVGFAILFAGVSYAVVDGRVQSDGARHAIVVSGRNVATDSCNARFRQQQVLRRIVRSNKPTIRQYVKDGTLTPAQGRRALNETAATVAKLKLPDCRVVASVLTDDPSKLKPNQPPPLYEGSPGSAHLPGKG